jgi:hypothetical protein
MAVFIAYALRHKAVVILAFYTKKHQKAAKSTFAVW